MRLVWDIRPSPTTRLYITRPLCTSISTADNLVRLLTPRTAMDVVTPLDGVDTRVAVVPGRLMHTRPTRSLLEIISLVSLSSLLVRRPVSSTLDQQLATPALLDSRLLHLVASLPCRPPVRHRQPLFHLGRSPYMLLVPPLLVAAPGLHPSRLARMTSRR